MNCRGRLDPTCHERTPTVRQRSLNIEYRLLVFARPRYRPDRCGATTGQLCSASARNDERCMHAHLIVPRPVANQHVVSGRKLQ